MIEFSKTLNEISVDNMDKKNDDKFDKFFKQCMLDSSSAYQKGLNKIKKIDKNEKEKFFELKELPLLVKNKISVKNEILGILDQPKFENFFKPNLCIGYKRKGSKIFTYLDENENRKIYEIKNYQITEKNYDALLEKKNEKYDKFYCLSLK